MTTQHCTLTACKQVEARIGHTFADRSLLVTALTHSSYQNEKGQNERGQNEGGHTESEQASCEHNERLEFLGDAVLDLIVSEHLYARFPTAREGELTRMRSQLVKERALADVARGLELGPCLFLGRGEEGQGGRDRDALLCDAVEAIIGAVYLDGGHAAANRVVERLIGPHWPTQTSAPRRKDFKTALQELTQQRFRGRPSYRVRDESGPDHERTFTVEATLPDGSAYTGTGRGKKMAEQQAARTALLALQNSGTA